MRIVDTQQIVLFLDLATDNPIPEEEVLEQIPPCSNRSILRLSKFGADATSRGQQSIRWRRWTLAVDRMLAAAKACTDDGRTPHYYVAGRGSLPLFAYLGLRRGRQGRLTVLNRRDSGTWDVIPTQPMDGPPSASFFGEPMFTPGEAPRGHLAVILSTGYDVSQGTIEGYLARNREGHAGTVLMQTGPGGARWLTADRASAAAFEVGELFRGLRRFAPGAQGVALFLAGPASLAVMAGRVLNPHIHRPIWIPAFDGGDYSDAVRWPQGAVHGGELRILVMTASPSDQRPIRVHEEERELRACLLDGLVNRERLKLEVVRAATVDDILVAMNRHKPHILHISAHGTKDGDLSFLNDRGEEALVPLKGLAAAVQSAGDSLQMIILNACYSTAATKVLVNHVDCAIGMRLAIGDASAIQFTRGFYGALGYGCSVGQAYEQGLANIQLRTLPNSKGVELDVRDGCDADAWVPLPMVSQLQ